MKEGVLCRESFPIYRLSEPPRVGIAYLVNDELWVIRAIQGAVMTIQRGPAPTELRGPQV